jgi:azurin
MPMNPLNIYLIITIILAGCNQKQKKEEFQYERVQENSSEVIQNNAIENTIILNSNDAMLFDKKVIKVNYGEKITLTLNHVGKIGKNFMGHNFVLLKKDVDVDDFAQRAIQARDNEYIPEGDEIIITTKILGGGESDTVVFDAPEPGKYIFICSFPGHYQLMRGEFIVI